MKKNILFSMVLVFGFIGGLFGQAGVLDGSFGMDGKVTTEFNNGYFSPVSANIQSDGKVIVAGQVWGIPDFKLVRYGTDGNLDVNFGFELIDGSASVFAIQPDGKYLLAGSDLRRYDTAGNIDTGFGNAGVTYLEFNVTCMVLQPDGKIVVAGNDWNDIVVARFHSNGSKDYSFGTNGMVTTNFSTSDEKITAIAIQTDLKIVVSGYLESSTNYDFAMVRYHPDGSLDNSFNTDGKVTTDFAGDNDKANAMAVQPDGKIVLAGGSSDGMYYNFALARYDTDGNLDVNFGTGGKVITNFEGSEGISISLLTGGKIVVAGNAGSDFAVARYNTDGTLDNSFDDDGKTTTDIDNRYEFAKTMVTGSGGEIIIVGTSDFDCALTKYKADGILDPSFSNDGIVTSTLGQSIETAKALAIQPNGKIVVAGNQNLGATMARYNTDGSLDNSFEADEILRGDFNSIAFSLQSSNVSSLAIQPSGKILLGQIINHVYGNGTLMRQFNTDGSLGDFETSGGEIALQPNGKILAAGRINDDFSFHQTSLDRFHFNGLPDTTFGTNGKVIISASGSSGGGAYFPIPAIFPNGNILIGCSLSEIGTTKLAFLKYDTSGVMDSAFGPDGKYVTDLEEWEINTLIIQPDEKILFAGSVVARFNADGSPDISFGTNGIVSPGFPTHIALQSDGKILATGTSNDDFALFRFHEDGTPDDDFGQNGWVTTDFNGGVDIANAIALQPDGKIVVAGSSDGDFAIARYLSGLETSVFEKPESKVSVLDLLPNPATNFLTLQLPETTEPPTVQVFDAQGRLALLATGQRLDVQGLAPGMFSLRAVVGERVYVGRFVKQ